MLAMACGALAGAKPMLGLGIVFAIAFVGLVLVDLTLGVYAFGAAIYVEAIPEIERAISLTKMMGSRSRSRAGGCDPAQGRRRA